MKGIKMSDLEYDAFEEHCKSTETYKEVVLRTYNVEPNGDLFIPSGEMAREDFDNYFSEAYNVVGDELGSYAPDYIKDGKYYSFEKAKLVKVKGYNKKGETK